MLDERQVLMLVNRLVRSRDREISLAQIARKAGWSESHVHRVFRSVVGQTPKQYTLRLRLEAAASALVRTQASVLDVALDAGFGSHEVFTRAFRRGFGCTPSTYRARAHSRSEGGDRAVEITTGPCVTLFRLPLEHLAQGSHPMADLTITEMDRAEQPVMFMRRRVPVAQLQPTMAQCLPAVFQHVQAQGLGIAGPPFTRYVSVSLGMVTVECGIPVARAAEDSGEILAGALPAGPAAVAVHEGPYDALQATHARVEQWIEAEGLATGGAPWESYVTDPADHPDPADWRTEVCWPLDR